MKRLLILSAVLIAALGCVAEPTDAGEQSSPIATLEPTAAPESRCVEPSPHVVDMIAEGLNESGGYSLTVARAVKSTFYEDSSFVAVMIEPVGVPGVWLLARDITSPDWIGAILSVNPAADTYSTWGTPEWFQGMEGYELAQQRDGYNEAVACAKGATP